MVRFLLRSAAHKVAFATRRLRPDANRVAYWTMTSFLASPSCVHPLRANSWASAWSRLAKVAQHDFELGLARCAAQCLSSSSAKLPIQPHRNAAGLQGEAGWFKEPRGLFEKSCRYHELAKKEKKSRQWIAVRVRFGRFLNFTTTVVKADSLPANRLSRTAQLPTDSINRRLIPARTRSGATAGQRAMIAADETSRPAFILERR